LITLIPSSLIIPGGCLAIQFGFLSFLDERKTLSVGKPPSIVFLSSAHRRFKCNQIFLLKMIYSKKIIPEKIISQFKTALKSGNTFLKSESLIVFTCGKKPNVDSPTARDRIIQYSCKHFPGFHFFKAEDFFNYFASTGDEENNLDLLSIENKLADYTDCIIIVLESPSAIAELGAFANHEKLTPLLLVINDEKFIGEDSFINLGPIAKVNKKSKFKPVIHTNLDSILECIGDISKRLEKIERKYGKKVDLSTYIKFREASPKTRVFFLADIIGMLEPIKVDEVIDFLRVIYEENLVKIKFEIGVLKTLDIIDDMDGFLFMKSNDKRGFYDFKFLDTLGIKSSILNHYHKYFEDRVKVLKNRIKK
jgi:hypothetical protein